MKKEEFNELPLDTKLKTRIHHVEFEGTFEGMEGDMVAICITYVPPEHKGRGYIENQRILVYPEEVSQAY